MLKNLREQRDLWMLLRWEWIIQFLDGQKEYLYIELYQDTFAIENNDDREKWKIPLLGVLSDFN